MEPCANRVCGQAPQFGTLLWRAERAALDAADNDGQRGKSAEAVLPAAVILRRGARGTAGVQTGVVQ